MEVELAPLAPKDAIAYFRQKGFKESFAWEDMWQDEHSKAFTVAKMMNRDLLETTRAAIDKAISEGQTFEQFRKELQPRLVAAGWWGKQEILDPKTGKMKTVQLGSYSRLRTIFDTNLRTSMAAGRWQRIQRTKESFPYLMYDAVNDNRTRPEHRSWDKITLPVDHEFWDTHYPPNGWRCRCSVLQLNKAMMDNLGVSLTKNVPQFQMVEFRNRRTGEISLIEKGIDPGFSFNPGKSPLVGIVPRAPEAAPKKPIKGLSEAVLGFLRVFGADKKSRIIKDRDNWPVAIGAPMFMDAAGVQSVPRPDLVKLLPIVAAALRDYDFALWVWGEDAAGKALLIRRYVKQLDKQIITIDFSGGVWTYSTTPNPK